MRIRKDSPFHGITEDFKEYILTMVANGDSYDDVAEMWENKTGKETFGEQVRRFVERVRYERAVRETDDSMEDLTAFAERATDGKARDGLIEAARQKLFEDALAAGDRTLLLELYRAANEERAREREVEVQRRKAAVAEENARIGWVRALGEVNGKRKFLAAEVTASKAVNASAEGGEQSLLPALRELLMDATKQPEERLAAVLKYISSDDGKLLPKGGGE
jgi:hypothetical protein